MINTYGRDPTKRLSTIHGGGRGEEGEVTENIYVGKPGEDTVELRSMQSIELVFDMPAGDSGDNNGNDTGREDKGELMSFEVEKEEAKINLISDDGDDDVDKDTPL